MVKLADVESAFRDLEKEFISLIKTVEPKPTEVYKIRFWKSAIHAEQLIIEIHRNISKLPPETDFAVVKDLINKAKADIVNGLNPSKRNEHRLAQAVVKLRQIKNILSKK